MLCSGISVGAHASLSSASVSSGREFQGTHALFFPRPTKAVEVSHPVSALNIGRARDFSAPRQAAILWAAKYQKLFLVPNASQTSSLADSVCTTIPANTMHNFSITSMYKYTVMAMLCSIATRSNTYECLPLHGCMHGASEYMSCCGGTQGTCSPSVTTSSLLSSSNDWMSAFERKLKSSFLLRSTRRKFASFPVWVQMQFNEAPVHSIPLFCPDCCLERVNKKELFSFL